MGTRKLEGLDYFAGVEIHNLRLGMPDANDCRLAVGRQGFDPGAWLRRRTVYESFDGNPGPDFARQDVEVKEAPFVTVAQKRLAVLGESQASARHAIAGSAQPRD